jgi:ribulose-phosphate 3-epimerase
VKAGLVLNPHNPVFLLEEIIIDLDLVCIMSVNPGYGGQSFIPSSLGKINKLRNLISNKNAPTLIEVDGGVDFENAKDLVEAGANVLVTGNTVFSADDPEKAISDLKHLNRQNNL